MLEIVTVFIEKCLHIDFVSGLRACKMQALFMCLLVTFILLLDYQFNGAKRCIFTKEYLVVLKGLLFVDEIHQFIVLYLCNVTLAFSV